MLHRRKGCQWVSEACKTASVGVKVAAYTRTNFQRRKEVVLAVFAEEEATVIQLPDARITRTMSGNATTKPKLWPQLCYTVFDFWPKFRPGCRVVEHLTARAADYDEA